MNLMGYYRQNAGSEGGSAINSKILLPAAGYPGIVNIDGLFLSSNKFMNGKECYIGYNTIDVWGEEVEPGLSGLINKYYGPYYFNFGIVEIRPVEDWKERIGSWIDSEGNINSILPDDINYGHCNWIFCIVGEPAENASWHDILPENGFCANYNSRYAEKTMYNLRYEAIKSILTNLKTKATGSQYKFNGRYISSGNSNIGSKVNINTDLKKYDGFRSWASGWLHVSDSSYYYIKNQYGGLDLSPSCNNAPFINYSKTNIEANPDFVHYLTKDIIVPSISTVGPMSSIATASTVSFRKNITTGRNVVYSCAIPEAAFLNNPFQMNGQFPGYSYPTTGRSGLWVPSWESGFIFTSEGVTL